ncbi:Uma2 family endonuclease [Scytonema sp. NUACC26]|uniref:Uma2 family endonuclease n=1 Tax=Scytonema sp. NUACC26 TaxID=3140176 RepID=UPI0034DCB5A9
MILEEPSWDSLPSPMDLVSSDVTPTDDELQNLVPSLLNSVLAAVWTNRTDWCFGISMGIFYDPNELPAVPDAFLSVGTQRVIDDYEYEDLRLCYVSWIEQVAPIMVLEIVPYGTSGEEYIGKRKLYEKLDILYYVIYNPRRRRKTTFEVFRLINGTYILQPGSPVWLEEVGLGIGCERGTYLGITRDWLYWYDRQGIRYPTPEERVALAEQRAQRLADELRRLGIDPETIT